MLIQRFGAGGGGAVVLRVSGFAVTTVWTRHVAVFDAPSLDGKTVMAGASVEAALERQAESFPETLELANVQLEIGAAEQTFASPFEFRDDATELALCRRYFERKTVRTQDGARHVPLAPKRAAPSITVSAGTAAHITADGFELSHTAAQDCIVTASAEL